MKRNYLLLEEEDQDANRRGISIKRTGDWISEKRHVKLTSLEGISVHLLSYSHELKYHYLNPYEALFCLESSELLIFYEGYPLSLAEAYHLLIKDDQSLKNYRIFQRLNRTGFVCLKPQVTKPETALMSKADNLQTTESLSVGGDDNDDDDGKQETIDLEKSIYKIDALYELTFAQVLQNLRKHGPQEAAVVEQATDCCNDEIVFDVYQKQNFHKNKPSRGKAGNPDHYLIIRDNIANGDANFIHTQHLSSKILFALIDVDDTICFVKFGSVNSNDFRLF